MERGLLPKQRLVVNRRQYTKLGLFFDNYSSKKIAKTDRAKLVIPGRFWLNDLGCGQILLLVANF